jgi:hypothetical protein
MYMLPEDFASLNLARYELNLRACETCALPAFLGSTIRGAFGHALKETVCIMPHRDCTRCLVADRCFYTYLFETSAPPEAKQLSGQQQVPHPYILTPPYTEKPAQRVWKISQPKTESKDTDANKPTIERSATVFSSQGRRHYQVGDELTFKLLLMGRANESLSYLVYAISEMGRRGLGANRTPFELKNGVTVNDKGEKTVVYSKETQRLLSQLCASKNLSQFIKTRLAELETLLQESSIKLRFLTPTRIRANGDLQTAVTFELLV